MAVRTGQTDDNQLHTERIAREHPEAVKRVAEKADDELARFLNCVLAEQS